MKKLILGALLIVSSIFVSVKQPVYAETATPTTTTEVLTFVENQNQFDIGAVSGFAVSSNAIYYANNFKLNKFDTTTKNNYSLPYENVTSIKQSKSYVVFISDSKLVIFKNGNEVTIPGLNATCDFFNIYEQDDNLFISYVENSTLHFVKINSNMNIDIQREHNLGSIELVTTCLNESYTYIVVRNGSHYGMLKVNNLTFEQTSLSFSYACSHIEMFEQDGKTYFLIITRINQALSIAEEQVDAVVPITTSTKLTDVTSHETFSLGEVGDFTDATYYDGYVYVADKLNKSIQAFEIENQKFVPSHIVLSSNAYEAGYFNNINDFQIVDSSTLLVADTQNNRIQKLEEENVEVISTYNSASLVSPKFYLTSNNQDFWFYFDGKLVKQSDITNLEYVIGNNVSDMKVDNSNNVYYLDYDLDKLVTIAQNKNILEGVIENLNLSENSKLEILNNGFVIFSDNTFKVYNLNYEEVSSLTITANIKDVTSDYFGNIYVLTDEGIIKLNNANNVLSQGTTLTYQANNLTLFSLNKVTGEFVAFDSVNSRFIKIVSLEFISSLNDFEHVVNALELPPQETILSGGNVLAETYISKYPYNTGISNKLAKDTKVFVLAEVENSYYIMYNNNNTVGYGYITKDKLEVIPFTINEPNKVVVINKNIKLYTLPTILRDNGVSFVYTTCQLNSQLNVVNFNLVSIDNSEYFAVQTENNKILYVNASDVTLLNSNEISSLPDLNAELIVADNSMVNLYEKDTVNSEIILELDASQKVYVENFDTTKEFTYVTVITEDKTQISGYVLTKHLRLLDNNPNLTSAYILLGVAFVIGISSIIVFVKYKKSDDN